MCQKGKVLGELDRLIRNSRLPKMCPAELDLSCVGLRVPHMLLVGSLLGPSACGLCCLALVALGCLCALPALLCSVLRPLLCAVLALSLLAPAPAPAVPWPCSARRRFESSWVRGLGLVGWAGGFGAGAGARPPPPPQILRSCCSAEAATSSNFAI